MTGVRGCVFGDVTSPNDFLLITPLTTPSTIYESDGSTISKHEQPEGDCLSIQKGQLTLMSKPESHLQDLQMMKRCLELAQHGVEKGELPFGAVIVSRGRVIAEATNCVSSEGDVTRHAELVALSNAQKVLKRKRLPDCTLYSIV